MTGYVHKVNYYETDKMGITHHSNYIRFMEEARMDFLSEVGYPMTKLEERGITSPVVSVTCEYKHTTTYCDEIEVSVEPKKYTGVRLILSYTMRNLNTDEVVAVAASEHCFIDKNGRPLAVRKCAPEFDEILKKLVSAASPQSDDILGENIKENRNNLTDFNTMTTQMQERESRLRRELVRAKKEKCILEQKANIDPLTGIGNRNRFQSAIREALQGETAVTVCYCDLDNLKYVNDHFGHTEGDRYIGEFVKLVREHIREDDVFTRIGGDEFCIILRDCTEDVARYKLALIQRKFEENSSAEYDRNFSYGIIYLPEGEHKIAMNELLHEADQAMYEQKNQHRMKNE